MTEYPKINAEHHFSYGNPPFQVECRVILCGRDILFVFGGGTGYHVGAVSICLYHPGIKDPSRHTVSPSVFTLPGHKEDMLARSAAVQLSRGLGRNVIVAVGLHVDQATLEDIQHLEENFSSLVNQVQSECVTFTA